MVDFGDLQLFEGVTTYPAILTMRKAGGAEAGPATLQFLNLKTLPADLALAFADSAEPMPRARLSATGWRFEGDRLDAIRAKMAAGRRTLAEVYGAPLYGIKTGLNEAFVLDRATRDALIAADGRSAELLKPFLIGENLKRWHVESDDLWLIYTPRNKVDIEAYPAIRDHLLPFRDRLEARATRQNWWELQQAQAAYATAFQAGGLTFPDLSQGPKFSIAPSSYVDCTGFRVEGEHWDLLSYANSKCSWFQLFSVSNPMRGGQWRLRLKTQYVSGLSIPKGLTDLGTYGQAAHQASSALAELSAATLHRLADIHPAIETTAAFRAWPDVDFARLRALIGKRFRTDIAPGERDDWERWYEGKRAEAAALRARIAEAEAEINARTYALFGLDADEIRLIEESLAGQY